MKGIDTLYTDENVYVLQVDRSKAFRTYRNLREPDLTETAPTYYRETIRFEENVNLGYSSPAEDPWVWGYRQCNSGRHRQISYLFAERYRSTVIEWASTQYYDRSLGLFAWRSSRDHLHQWDTGTRYQYFGGNNYAGDIDTVEQWHTAEWDESASHGSCPVAHRVHRSDAVAFEAITVEYSRAFVARNGALSFEGDAKLFTVDGLPSDQVSVFSYYRNRLWKLDQVQTCVLRQRVYCNIPWLGNRCEVFCGRQ